MASLKEWLPFAKEQYKRARQLMDVESAKDPVNEPFKSRYEAAKILEALKEKLNEFEDSFSEEEPLNNATLINIVIKIDLGINSIETEEFGIGEQLLISALNIIEEKFSENSSIILYKCIALNQLGFLWSTRAEYETAAEHLRKAEESYYCWRRQENRENTTLSLMDAFTSHPLDSCKNSNALTDVEKTFTQSLYFLAQVYEKLERNDESAVYCKRTLRRQYESKEFDAVDWAMHTSTLSQYYATKNEFENAAHLIACGRFVLNNHLSNIGDDDERAKRAKADLARICVKHCLMLLEASKNSAAPQSPPHSENVEMLTDDEISAIECKIPCKIVTQFDDARTVFLEAQNYVNQAKEYYALDEHASDYVDCVQDNSKLYRLLAFFETDSDRKYKMHKRRVTMLQNLLSEINAQYFLAQNRQMLFELGETYSEMGDILILQTENKQGEELIAHVKKINVMITKAIKEYIAFIETFKDKSKGELPTTFDEEMVKPILVAYFSIGRLHSKLYSSDPRDQLRNWTSCEQYYKKVVEYTERNPQHSHLVSEELSLVEEMLRLIPRKLSLLLNSTMY
ncbi:hypothetical protein B4U80_07399 [Leptotrombidium deliense]|uniref:KIF-binding protein n=1 Tax=Leptotrombidium deliense TaxID=299467 RepID=A0A443SMN5_9ACAR|nr:hypothetical protein B4U80_07399 [Leptotrombidium deliense]